MNIVIIQETPHTVFEVQGYAGTNDFNDIIAWCHLTDLPEDLSLSFEGTVFRLRTRPERICWALGFDKAFDLTHDEPVLPLHTDFDGVVYLRLGTSEDREGLHKLKNALLQELYLSKWPDHDGDFQVVTSCSFSIHIRQDVWKGLSFRQKQSLADRCQGYCEGLDASPVY